MHGHDQLRLGSDEPFNGGWIDIEGVINFRANRQGGDGALNGRGAGGDCECELRLHAGGEFFFEWQDFGGRVCAVPTERGFCFQDFE